MTEGDLIPDTILIAVNGASLPLRTLIGAPLVLYFYPRDDTPGCTREAQDFSALADDFAALGVTLLGVSQDPPERHAKFAAKHDLKVRLATDDSGATMVALDVWVEKSMYGKRYMGIERSTFLFDADGSLVTQWRKVKVPGHAAAVLAAVKQRQLR